MENYVLMYWSSEFVKNSKLLNEPNHVNSIENQRTYQFIEQHMQHCEHQCSNGGQLIKDASQNALLIICDYWLEVIAHGYFWSGLNSAELFIIFGHFQGC